MASSPATTVLNGVKTVNGTQTPVVMGFTFPSDKLHLQTIFANAQWTIVFGASAAFITASITLWTFYSLFLHPLAKFPGPKWAAITPIYYFRMAWSGRLPMKVQELHKRYGHVVRISPNELSFASAESYRDIYAQTGDSTFVKSKFYKVPDFNASDIIGESDVTVHAHMRKLWAHGFSNRALVSHEELEQRYVDLLVEQIRYYGNTRLGMNMVEWYNYLTFDIIGELVFGEGFGSLKKGTSAFWIAVILDNMAAGLIIDLVRRLGLSLAFKSLIALLPLDAIKAMNEHTRVTREMAAKRLARPKDDKRQDFLAAMLADGRDNVIGQEEVAAQGQNLIIAGSETTATTLSAVTYYLLKHPQVYAKFKDEIRAKFSRYEDINANAVGPLPYFHAVINEAMRLYPPVPFGPPRYSPGAFVNGEWVPKGTEVSVNPWTITRDPFYFRNPDQFIPERWLDPKSTDNHNAFQPFHLGPRVCLGRNLAFIELRLVLAKLHWTFDAELVDPTVDIERDSRMFILWNKPAINVRWIEREVEEWKEHVGDVPNGEGVQVEKPVMTEAGPASEKQVAA